MLFPVLILKRKRERTQPSFCNLFANPSPMKITNSILTIHILLSIDKYNNRVEIDERKEELDTI